MTVTGEHYPNGNDRGPHQTYETEDSTEHMTDDTSRTDAFHVAVSAGKSFADIVSR